ncbi:spidroin-1-like [Eucalyptus grandis]|uniref:spidroin-1-like n=1 Tax=Eucalyptus grandis TaxID=71139 RepID=UPI00192EA978|nr:spidroin-1-like [Eucalyptus grandis]
MKRSGTGGLGGAGAGGARASVVGGSGRRRGWVNAMAQCGHGGAPPGWSSSSGKSGTQPPDQIAKQGSNSGGATTKGARARARGTGWSRTRGAVGGVVHQAETEQRGLAGTASWPSHARDRSGETRWQSWVRSCRWCVARDSATTNRRHASAGGSSDGKRNQLRDGGGRERAHGFGASERRNASDEEIGQQGSPERAGGSRGFAGLVGCGEASGDVVCWSSTPNSVGTSGAGLSGQSETCAEPVAGRSRAGRCELRSSEAAGGGAAG